MFKKTVPFVRRSRNMFRLSSQNPARACLRDTIYASRASRLLLTDFFNILLRLLVTMPAPLLVYAKKLVQHQATPFDEGRTDSAPVL